MNKSIPSNTPSGTDTHSIIESPEFQWAHGGSSEFHRWVLPPIKRWLKIIRPSNVLDLGCGNGYVTGWLCEQGIRSVGLDGSGSGILIARKNYPEIEFEEANFDLPLPQHYHCAFDLVISLDVIEHMLLPRQLMPRALEGLTSSGYMILSTPYHGYFKNVALALTNSFDKHWHPLRDFGHIKFFLRATLTTLCEEQGFEILDLVYVGRVTPLAKSMIVLLRRRS